MAEKTSRVKLLFDLHATSGWVVFKERLFAGKRIGESEYLLSRYRHQFFVLVPRIVVRLKVERVGSGSKVTLRSRFNSIGTIAFVILTLSTLIPIARVMTGSESPEADHFLPAFLYLYFLLAAYLEVKTVEKLILDVVKQEQIKSIFNA